MKSCETKINSGCTNCCAFMKNNCSILFCLDFFNNLIPNQFTIQFSSNLKFHLLSLSKLIERVLILNFVDKIKARRMLRVKDILLRLNSIYIILMNFACSFFSFTGISLIFVQINYNIKKKQML